MKQYPESHGGHEHAHRKESIDHDAMFADISATQSTALAKPFSLAVSATFHCLIGCGIGEVVGMIIAARLGLNNINSIVLSVVLGFIAGLLLGVVPLLRAQLGIKKALKTVLLAEGLSIVVMETFEVLTQVMTPGVMDAHLTDPVFWGGMILSLIAGFVAALPMNYFMIKRGVRHFH
jgi:hypothetical protein